MEKQKAKQIAIDGCLWLEKCIDNEGRFIYGYDSKSLKKVKGYNILRHFGSLWSMLQIVPFLDIIDRTTVINSVIKSLAYTENQYIDTYRQPGMKAVIEDGWIKLGGNGLASLCYLSAAKLPALDLKTATDFIKMGALLNSYSVKCIDENNGLFSNHKRNWFTGKDKGFKSGFYPGEALLAMATMLSQPANQRHVDKKTFFNFCKVSIMAYFKLREKEGHVRDHWMMQAIETICPFCEDQYIREVLIPYANAIKDTTLSDKPSQSAGPCACRSEMLLSWIRFARRFATGSQLACQIIPITATVSRQLNFQAESIIPRGLSKGAFTHSPWETEVRNDYTQHNISSVIGYYKLMGGI
jgi:hypothetical protein